MTKVTAWIRRLLAWSVLMGLMSVPQAQAQELSRSVAMRVHQAFELSQQEKTAEAVTILEGIDAVKAYDQAYVARMLGILYWQQAQPQRSQVALENALSTGALPIEQAIETERMLADILLSTGEPAKALRHYQSVLDKQSDVSRSPAEKMYTTEFVTQLWLRVAQSNYQLQDWQAVLSSIKQYQALDKKADVSLLSMKLGAQVALSHWKGAVSTTEQLRALESDNELWWKQLTSLHLRLKHYPEALATLKQRERKGFALSSSEYQTLAGLYASQGAPELAAKVYAEHLLEQEEAESYATLARYWQVAKEWQYALEAWQHASRLSEDHHWSYAQLLMQQKQYQAALNVLANMPSSQRVELAKTQAFYRLDEHEKALESAQKAHQLKADETTLTWVRFLTQSLNKASS